MPTESNGITNVLFNYLRAMDGSEVTADLLAINQPDAHYVKEVENKGGRVFALSRLGGTIAYWKSLRNLIRENKYDAVHIHGNSHTTVLELSAAKAAGCGVRMCHAHNTTCKHVVVHKLMAPVFHLLCTHGLACGDAAGRFMHGNRPFTVVNNGVDTDKFAFSPEHRETIRKNHNWHGCKVIGHVGYFQEVKNHQWIIEVFKELIKMDASYRLVLIGDGELRNKIVEKANEAGILEQITFTGNIKNVNHYLNAIDLIIMPSLYEGLPLTLIEQQACGLRCIVSDTITREVDKTGNLTFLSISLSAYDWARVINQFKIMTEEERAKTSECAVRVITQGGYSIKEEASKLKAYYLQTQVSIYDR